MIKKIIVITISVLMVLLSFIACKKTVKVGTKTLDASKIYNVFIAQSAEKTSLDDMRKGFVVGMKDLGLVEDINVKYTYENAKGSLELSNKIADNVIEKKPDLVVAIGPIVAESIFNKCKDTPIVFVGCANAEKLGFCDANGVPKGEITGVKDSHRIDERLDFIEKNYSDVKKLGIIYDKNNGLASYDVDYHKFYATAHNIDIYTVSIKKASDIDKALDNIMPKVDAIALVIDDMVDTVVPQIVERCNKENKPIFGKDKIPNVEGVIIDKEVDLQSVGKEAAKIANDILVNEKKASEINVVTIDFK